MRFSIYWGALFTMCMKAFLLLFPPCGILFSYVFLLIGGLFQHVRAFLLPFFSICGGAFIALMGAFYGRAPICTLHIVILQGRPQDLAVSGGGGGWGKKYFLRFGNLHMLVGSRARCPENFFLNGAIWCIYIWIRFCILKKFKNSCRKTY